MGEAGPTLTESHPPGTEKNLLSQSVVKSPKLRMNIPRE
jgi:hypothetical protein